MARTKGSPTAVTAKQRELDALKLRQTGLSYDQIGQRLGITRQGATKAVMRALNELKADVHEEAESVRALELQRLDAMLSGLYSCAERGEVQAVQAVLKLMERRAKLLGLDAPTKSELTGKDGEPLGGGAFAVPLVPLDRATWTAQALEQAKGEEAKAEELLNGKPADTA